VLNRAEWRGDPPNDHNLQSEDPGHPTVPGVKDWYLPSPKKGSCMSNVPHPPTAVNCPVFQSCSAAICPLDLRWRLAVHLPGEPVCRYLLAAGKEGATDHFRDDLAFAVCQTQLSEVCAKHPDIARRVARAASCPIKGTSRRSKQPGAGRKRD